MFKKIFKYFIQTFVILSLVLILLELFFHTAPLITFHGRQKINQILPEDQAAIRILALGESTTDELVALSHETHSWPYFLEKKLKEKGYSVRIYNEGIAGTTTHFILRDLNSKLDFYKPHIVIAMMGVNDTVLSLKSKQSWWQKFKLVQYWQWYNKLKPEEAVYLTDYPSPEPQFNEQLVQFAQTDGFNYENLKEKIERKLSEKTPQARAAHNAELKPDFSAKETELYVYDKFLESLSFGITDKQIEVALKIRDELDNGTYISGRLFYSSLVLLSRQNQFEKCYDFVSRVILQFKIQLTEKQMNLLSNCIFKDKALQVKRSRWRQLTANQINDIPTDQLENENSNFEKIFETIKSHKAELVAVQYPILKVKLLQAQFSPEHLNQITFVDNSEPFQTLVKQGEYSRLFLNNFAGSFGHTTEYGYQLLADNILHVVEKKVSELKK